MAMITCPECGRRITDLTDRCIGCGLSMETIKRMRPENVLRKKSISCIVCGTDYELSECRCPNCNYPALFLDKDTNKTAELIESYISETATGVLQNELNETEEAYEKAEKRDTSAQVISSPSNNDQKGRKRTVALIVALLLLAAIGASLMIALYPNDKKITEAYENYITAVVENADCYDSAGHPVNKNVVSKDYDEGEYINNNCDEYWLSYAIDDFDGDKKLEMMVLRKFLPCDEDSSGGDSLCMFEYEKGSVVEKRENGCLKTKDDYTPDGDFYQRI